MFCNWWNLQRETCRPVMMGASSMRYDANDVSVLAETGVNSDRHGKCIGGSVCRGARPSVSAPQKNGEQITPRVVITGIERPMAPQIKRSNLTAIRSTFRLVLSYRHALTAMARRISSKPPPDHRSAIRAENIHASGAEKLTLGS